MKKKSFAQVIRFALECAIAERQSLIDAYDGDKNEQAVKDAEQWIRAFSAAKIKLFGKHIAATNDPFKNTTSISILKMLAAGGDFSEYFDAPNTASTGQERDSSAAPVFI